MTINSIQTHSSEGGDSSGSKKIGMIQKRRISTTSILSIIAIAQTVLSRSKRIIDPKYGVLMVRSPKSTNSNP